MTTDRPPVRSDREPPPGALFALGRLVARRPIWFVLGWMAIAVAGFAAAGGAFGTEGLFARLQPADVSQVPGEARDGASLVEAAEPQGPSIQLLLDGVQPASAVVRAAVGRAAQDLSAIPRVSRVLTPYSGLVGAPSDAAVARALRSTPLVAEDGRAVLVVVSLTKGLSTADEAAATEAVTTRLREVVASVPGSTALVGGRQALDDEINHLVEKDLRTGEAVALPLSLLVMVVVFGGFLAAGAPIVGAIASVGCGLAGLLGCSHVMELDSTVPSVVTVMGLGLCIDYGLLLTSRYREELCRQEGGDRSRLSPPARQLAMGRTLSSAGRTVLFSALTVALSISALMFFDVTTLRADGAAGSMVVLLALLAALTLVPALLALAGNRMIRPVAAGGLTGPRRLLHRLGGVAPAEGVFSRLVRRIQRRPVTVLVLVLGVLVLVGSPVLHLGVVRSSYTLLPTTSPQRQLFQAMADRFPATTAAPVQVVARVAPDELARWGREVAVHLDAVGAVDPVVELRSDAERVAVLGLRPAPGVSVERTGALVDAVRAHRPPFAAFVTGAGADHQAFLASLRATAPLAVGTVVLATFVLLFLMTGSVLLPLKALLTNAVSLVVAFGGLVWVFGDGHLESLLAFTGAGGIDATVPALVLAFVFGLSTDYEVFLLSRIKEHRDRGGSSDLAVAAGLQGVGRTIVSAALVIAIVFAGFAAGQLLVIKELGVALVIAVVVDVAVVRMVLVPAAMTLLGELGWWAPRWMRGLHARWSLAVP